MAFIPVPYCAQVNIIQQLSGEDVENVFYVSHLTPDWSPVELVDVASYFISYWSANIMPLLATEFSFQKVRVRDLNNAGEDGYEQAVSPIVTGAVGGGAMPGSAALAVKKSTGLVGRSHRGRVYMSGLVKPNVTINLVNQAWVTQIVGELQNMIGDINGTLGDVKLAHVSRYTNGLPRIQGAYWDIVSFTADNRLDSQRRRLAGRGR